MTDGDAVLCVSYRNKRDTNNRLCMNLSSVPVIVMTYTCTLKKIADRPILSSGFSLSLSERSSIKKRRFRAFCGNSDAQKNYAPVDFEYHHEIVSENYEKKSGSLTLISISKGNYRLRYGQIEKKTQHESPNLE